MPYLSRGRFGELTEMKLLQVVGARPQFVKLAPVSAALARRRAGGLVVEEIVLHTGQHYDPSMSKIFFDELGLPRPAVNLEVGSGSHGQQTAQMLEGVERCLVDWAPDAVIVYGDTNSTLAGTLAAVKLGVPVAHVEAGLRSFNRSMPEELNRIATDHLADLLLAPTVAALENLAGEGLAARSALVGDVMLDAVLAAHARANRESKVLSDLGLDGVRFAFVTIHRAENTLPERLPAVLELLGTVAESTGLPLVFAVHPRTRLQMESASLDVSLHPAIRLTQPLSYIDAIRVLGAADFVLTDSGGLQKEAFCVGTPCITLRAETEWLETVAAGANHVVGLDQQRLAAALDAIASGVDYNRERQVASAAEYYGGGHAADRVVDAVLHFLMMRSGPGR